MKKIEYIVPEMEVLELKYCKMLCASDPSQTPGTDNPDEW